MKYEFSLEVVLEHRRRTENEARRVFLEAQAKVDQAVAQLNEYYAQVDRTREQNLTLQLQGGANAPSLTANESFITGQKFRIDSQRMMIRDLKMEAEALQEALLEAAKEVKTLEKLKERQLEEFKKKRRKHEAREIDEIVTLRHKNQDG
jgi:flagellar export protein FliJ